MKGLENAFPKMPENCYCALMNAARAGSAARRRAPRRALALVLLLVLVAALAGAALALTNSGVLRYLLGLDPPGAALQGLVQEIRCSAEADDIRFTITGVVYDGERLVLSYDAENLRPEEGAFVRLESIALDGTPVDPEEDEWPRLIPSTVLDVLPARRNPAGGGMTGVFRQALSGSVRCEATFVIERAQKGIAFVDDRLLEDLSGLDETSRLEYEDQRKAIAALQNAVVADDTHQDAQAWQDDGYTVCDASGVLLDEELSHLTETGRVTTSFFLDADAARQAAREWEGPAVLPLADCTLEIEKLRLSPLATEATLVLVPVQNTQAAASRLRERFGSLLLTDEAGHALAYAGMDYMLDTAGHVMETDGRWICRYRLEMPGLQLMPKALRIVFENGEELLWALDER